MSTSHSMIELKANHSKKIEMRPDCAGVAWNAFGFKFTDAQGQIPLAIHHFEKLIVFDPNALDAQKVTAQIDILKKANVFDRAVAARLRASNLSATDAMVYGNLSGVYNDRGLFELAIDTSRRAVELQPNFPDAYCNLADALKAKGHMPEAEESYNTALRLCPTHAYAFNNLACMKRDQQSKEEATRLYISALTVCPEFGTAHSNLAFVLHEQGKTTEAVLHYKEAIRIKSTQTEPKIGKVFEELQNATGTAMQCYMRAIEISPNLHDAYSNLGCVLKDLDKLPEAIASFREALKLKPDHHHAYLNLEKCLKRQCDWTDYDSRMVEITKIVQHELETKRWAAVHALDSLIYPFSHELRKALAMRKAEECLEKVSKLPKSSYSFGRQLETKRLRIGYVSSDFGRHPVSHAMQSVPGLHEREHFEIFCYSLSGDDGSTFYRKIATEAEHFIDLSKIRCDRQAADRIYDDGIHILINMNGYTRGERNGIFALRPAPIQVMWLGFPGTSGANFMDYILTDAITSPADFIDQYSEKLAYMPHTYFLGDHMQMFAHLMDRIVVTEKMQNEDSLADNVAVINGIDLSALIAHSDMVKEIHGMQVIELPSMKPIKTMIDNQQRHIVINGVTVSNGLKMSQLNKKAADGEEITTNLVMTTRQQYDLPQDAVVYCCFNQLHKFDPQTFKSWMKILKSVPNSVLWLVRFPADGESNLRKFAQKFGVSNDRIIFTYVATKEEHVRRGQLADVCLDTRLYNGHTTTLDVLWSGTPVVTHPAERFSSRVAASLLTTLGCRELIAQNRKQYEQIAIRLGTDRDYLRSIRQKVWSGRVHSPLFDCKAYTIGLEIVFKRMWNQYSSNEPNDHITDTTIQIHNDAENCKIEEKSENQPMINV